MKLWPFVFGVGLYVALSGMSPYTHAEADMSTRAAGLGCLWWQHRQACLVCAAGSIGEAKSLAVVHLHVDCMCFVVLDHLLDLVVGPTFTTPIVRFPQCTTSEVCLRQIYDSNDKKITRTKWFGGKIQKNIDCRCLKSVQTRCLYFAQEGTAVNWNIMWYFFETNMFVAYIVWIIESLSSWRCVAQVYCVENVISKPTWVAVTLTHKKRQQFAIIFWIDVEQTR